MIYVKAYALTLIAFLGIDSIWLGIVARSFYASQLGSLMREDVSYAVAGAFYLAYVAGIVFFAVAPALAEGSWQRAAFNGALLGLLAYGTYDMTNLATIKNWPFTMSLVDMGWGTLLTATAAVIGYLTTRAFP
jgi:uncharacterized membrane protein